MLSLVHNKVTIIVLIFVGLTAGALAFGVFDMHLLLIFNPSAVPPITANPVEADKVFSISKFRSDAGHDYSMNSWDGESCRSMKHYFNWSQNVVNNMPVRSQPTPDHPNIKIFAPFDGTITAINPEDIQLGKQIFIASRKNPSFYVRLFHVDLLPSLKIGSNITSGQQIGTIGPMDGTDVSYEARIFPFKTVYLSIFQYMTPQAFTPYAKLGYKPTDFILSRADADALDYQCDNNQQFVRPQNFYNNPNAMTEGYVQLHPNPYQNLYNNQQEMGR